MRRGRQLEYFTIGYNSLEGVTSIVAGLIAGSVSLVGFGLDSMIEVASGCGTALATPSRPGRFAARASRTNCVADGRSVLRCSGVVHPLRIQLHVDPARSTGTKHCRHRDRRHFGGRHAAAGPSETTCCSPDWQRSDARRFETGRFLQLPFRDSPGWPAVECVARLVVDGSGCRTGDGSDHREGRHRRTPRQDMLRQLRTALVRRAVGWVEWPAALYGDAQSLDDG